MSLFKDAYTLYIREMLILKKNLITTIIRSLMFPLVFILLLGNLGNSASNVPIAIVNYNNGPISFRFINALELQNAIQITNITDQYTAMQLLANGQVTSVVIIPAGFGTASNAGITIYADTSTPTASAVADAAITSVASQFKSSVSSLPATETGASVSTNFAYGAGSSYETFLVAGIVIMVAAFGSIWSGGMTLITDRQLGNLKAFMATPINKLSILLSKIMYGVTQSMMSSILALAIGLAAGATIASGPFSIILIIWFAFLAAVGFAGIATALASRITKIEVYSLIGMAFILPLWMLSGAFFPASSLPKILQPFNVYNPMTYGINAVRDIMLKGYLPVTALILYSIILAVFAIAALALSFLLFKNVNVV